MIKVTEQEFLDEFDHYFELARTEPICITSDDKEDVVLISIDQFDHLKEVERLARKHVAAIEALKD